MNSIISDAVVQVLQFDISVMSRLGSFPIGEAGNLPLKALGASLARTFQQAGFGASYEDRLFVVSPACNLPSVVVNRRFERGMWGLDDYAFSAISQRQTVGWRYDGHVL